MLRKYETVKAEALKKVRQRTAGDRAVSYTHLDVYKRQELFRIHFCHSVFYLVIQSAAKNLERSE